jgi:hypothetical protein
MENNMVMVTSASDFTLVVNIPELQLRRVWQKRGSKFPIDRDLLIQAYYNASVESMFRNGRLTTNDVEFLKAVGLMEEDGTSEVISLSESYLTRLIKAMPAIEVEKELEKLTKSQLEELVEYAIEHYTELKMDRIELFTKASGKDMMKAIDHYRKAQEV